MDIVRRKVGVIRAVPFMAVMVLMSSLTAWGQVHVVTQHNDNGRTGANLGETVLNTSNVNVNQFGKLFTRAVDGQIYAQPLIVSGVNTSQGVRNVLYVATMKNNLYAFDADDPSASAPLWQVNLGSPVPSTDVSEGGDIIGFIGITGTPVIDVATGTLYCVAKTKESNSYVQRLHALDIANGAPRLGGPVVIAGSVPGTGEGSVGGTISFDPMRHMNRPALLLSNGYIYIAFGSHEDNRPFHGWIFSYDATTLQRVGIRNVTAGGWGGSIWQSGQGPAADSDGYIYFATANGSFDMNTGGQNCSSCFIKLSGPSLAVVDWFSPYNQNELNTQNFELNTSGPFVVPGTNKLVGGGKEGIIYVLDRGNLGHFRAGGDTQIPQSLQLTFGAHLHGSAIYWEDPAKGPLVFIWHEDSPLKAFKMINGLIEENYSPTTGLLVPTAMSTMTVPEGMPGGMLSLSAHGSAAGTGIVWASTPFSGDAHDAVVPGILRAFDASDVSKVLWDSKQNAPRDDPGNFAKYTTPTIANGKVYLPTFSNQVVVYGLTGPTVAPTVISVSPNSGPVTGGTAVTITGTNFLANAIVSFGSSTATNVSVVNSTTITGVTPAGALGPVSVTITNWDGQSASLSTGFTYTVAPAPTVSGISPALGSSTGGTAVTISGTNFGASATVSLGSNAATNVKVVNSTTITATTPAGPLGAVSVTVTNSDGQSATLAAAFTYISSAPTASADVFYITVNNITIPNNTASYSITFDSPGVLANDTDPNGDLLRVSPGTVTALQGVTGALLDVNTTTGTTRGRVRFRAPAANWVGDAFFSYVASEASTALHLSSDPAVAHIVHDMHLTKTVFHNPSGTTNDRWDLAGELRPLPANTSIQIFFVQNSGNSTCPASVVGQLIGSVLVPASAAPSGWTFSGLMANQASCNRIRVQATIPAANGVPVHVATFDTNFSRVNP